MVRFVVSMKKRSLYCKILGNTPDSMLKKHKEKMMNGAVRCFYCLNKEMPRLKWEYVKMKTLKKRNTANNRRLSVTAQNII